jgi:hypothetical protein
MGIGRNQHLESCVMSVATIRRHEPLLEDGILGSERAKRQLYHHCHEGVKILMLSGWDK